jgi:hypothetical protein
MIDPNQMRISISDTMSLVAQLTGRQCGCEIGSKKEAIDYFLGTLKSRVGVPLHDKYGLPILKSRDIGIAKNFVQLVLDEADGKLPPTVEGDFKPQGDTSMPSPVSTPIEETNPAPEDTAVGQRGRKSSFAGKTLNANVVGNERRAGSHGFRSLQIVIDNPGISVEDFIAKGGRSNDLKWDVDKGNVSVS